MTHRVTGRYYRLPFSNEGQYLRDEFREFSVGRKTQLSLFVLQQLQLGQVAMVITFIYTD